MTDHGDVELVVNKQEPVQEQELVENTLSGDESNNSKLAEKSALPDDRENKSEENKITPAVDKEQDDDDKNEKKELQVGDISPIYVSVFIDSLGLAFSIPTIVYFVTSEDGLNGSATDLGISIAAYSGAAIIG